MQKVQTALIIGGGIAGPVTATALRIAGIDAAVYEAYPPHSDGIGSALALAPNGMAALEIIGAADAVRDAALPIAHNTMSMHSRHVTDFPALLGVEPQQMVERADLHRILQERAADAGVEFHHNKRLVDIDEHGNGVTARFHDGTTATADVLIGADGVRSTVRSLIDPRAPDADYTGLLGFGGRADVDIDLEPGTMTFAFGRRAYYLYWATPGGDVAWGANLPSPQYMSLSEARKIPKADWLQRLKDTYAGDQPGELLANHTAVEDLDVLGAIHIMPPIPHWHRGRMVLVGDAVHAPSNSTGQGASLAIESGLQLARCLRDLPDAPTAFAAYESMRRDRVETITRRGARLNRSKAPGPIAARLMRTLMPIMVKRMDIEKTMGPEQRYLIDWDARVSPPQRLSASS